MDSEKLIDHTILTPELLEFAETFSKNFRSYPYGTYYSVNKTYKIEYISVITDTRTGRPQTTFARIGMTTGTIQMDATELKKPAIKEDYIYYLILWCVVQRHSNDLSISDNFTINYCIKNNRNPSDILAGYEAQLKRLSEERPPSKMALNYFTRVAKIREIVKKVINNIVLITKK